MFLRCVLKENLEGEFVSSSGRSFNSFAPLKLVESILSVKFVLMIIGQVKISFSEGECTKLSEKRKCKNVSSVSHKQ